MNISRFISLSPIFKSNKISSNSFGFKRCCCIENYISAKYPVSNLQARRYVSTCEVKTIHKEEGLIKKVLYKIPFLNFDKMRISASAYLLYECIANQLNYINFIDEVNLPDTFYSWFVIMELHIWMVSVRAMAEGTDGKYLRNGLIEAFWLDVADRVKKLGISSTLIKHQVYELSEQLQAALLAYDEGLQSSDITLAGALWRRLYQAEDVQPENLVKLVKYIRKQITLLDNIPRDTLFVEKSLRFDDITKL